MKSNNNHQQNVQESVQVAPYLYEHISRIDPRIWRQRNFINERASFQLRKCHKCPSSNCASSLKHAKCGKSGDLRTFISPFRSPSNPLPSPTEIVYIVEWPRLMAYFLEHFL